MGDDHSNMLSTMFTIIAAMVIVLMIISVGVGAAAGVSMRDLLCSVIFFCGLLAAACGLCGLIASKRISLTKSRMIGYVANKQITVDSIINKQGPAVSIKFMLNVIVNDRAYQVPVTDIEFAAIEVNNMLTCKPVRSWYGGVKNIRDIRYAISEKEIEKEVQHAITDWDEGVKLHDFMTTV